MIRKLALAGLTAASIAAVGLASLFALSAQECPTEDSTVCTWYVDSGNGHGKSFTDFGPFGVAYWTR